MIDRIERGGSILVETPSTSLMATRIISPRNFNDRKEKEKSKEQRSLPLLFPLQIYLSLLE